MAAGGNLKWEDEWCNRMRGQSGEVSFRPTTTTTTIKPLTEPDASSAWHTDSKVAPKAFNVKAFLSTNSHETVLL